MATIARLSRPQFGVEAEKLEDRLVELEGMKQYLEMAIQALDKRVASLSSPVDRMKKLLTAKVRPSHSLPAA